MTVAAMWVAVCDCLEPGAVTRGAWRSVVGAVLCEGDCAKVESPTWFVQPVKW